MKTRTQNTPYELRDEITTLWENNRKTIIKTAVVVAVTGVVLTAFFMGRTRILSLLKNSALYASGLELTHKLADSAGAATHKMMDKVNELTHHFADRTNANNLN